MKALRQAILKRLGDGSETTLLLLDELAQSQEGGENLREEALLKTLEGLESEGLIVRQQQEIVDPRVGPDGGVPEFGLARDEVLWWQLTTLGAAAVRATVAGDRSPP